MLAMMDLVLCMMLEMITMVKRGGVVGGSAKELALLLISSMLPSRDAKDALDERSRPRP